MDSPADRALAVLPYFAGSVAVALVIAVFVQLAKEGRFRLWSYLRRAFWVWAIMVALSPLLLLARCAAFLASIHGCINC
jgi:hypothetical protein